METLDQQLIDILELAGETIFQDAIIEDHRVALARANMASEQLYRKLHEIKVALQEEGDVF